MPKPPQDSDSPLAESSRGKRDLEALFGILPISVWVEDFSAAHAIRERLKNEGVTDFRAHFLKHEEAVIECLHAVEVLAVNAETLRFHGATTRDQLLKELSKTFTKRSLETFREELIELFEGQVVTTHESQIMTLGGDPREVMVYVSVDPGVSNWARVFVLLVDITKQKEIETELRVQQAFLRETERVGQIGGWSLDAATREMRWTDEMYRIFGLDKGLVPPLDQALLQYPLEAREQLGSALEACLKEARPYNLELPFLDARGRSRWTRSVGHAEVKNGTVVRVNGTLQDVTAHHAAEELRRELEADAMHNQKLKSLGVLAGGIAHDFNNILSAVIGNAELAIAEIPFKSPCRQHLQEIYIEAQRAARLAGQMLAYSGRGHFTKEVVHLPDFIEELQAMLNVAVSKKAALSFEIQADLPPLFVDSSQLQQVLMNLVMNGSEALEGEGGHVQVSMRRETLGARHLLQIEEECPLMHETPTAPGDFFLIQVTDDGCGMEIDTQRQLLAPFFTTKFTGRGLGMAAVAGILRSQGGVISIDSAPNMGTAMKVYLPFEVAPVMSEAVNAQAPKPSMGPTPGRVLIAEDEDAVLGILTAILERLGYEVVQAHDGLHAIEMFEAFADELQLSIVDITMPELDGVEVFDRLHAAYPEHPVILTSGYDAVGLIPRLGDRKPAAFLQKPFTISDVEAALAAALLPA